MACVCRAGASCKLSARFIGELLYVRGDRTALYYYAFCGPRYGLWYRSRYRRTIFFRWLRHSGRHFGGFACCLRSNKLLLLRVLLFGSLGFGEPGLTGLFAPGLPAGSSLLGGNFRGFLLYRPPLGFTLRRAPGGSPLPGFFPGSFLCRSSFGGLLLPRSLPLGGKLGLTLRFRDLRRPLFSGAPRGGPTLGFLLCCLNLGSPLRLYLGLSLLAKLLAPPGFILPTIRFLGLHLRFWLRFGCWLRFRL